MPPSLPNSSSPAADGPTTGFELLAAQQVGPHLERPWWYLIPVFVTMLAFGAGVLLSGWLLGPGAGIVVSCPAVLPGLGCQAAQSYEQQQVQAWDAAMEAGYLIAGLGLGTLGVWAVGAQLAWDRGLHHLQRTVPAREPPA